MFSKLFPAFATLLLSLSTANAQPEDGLDGWWRAELEHAGKTSEVFLSLSSKSEPAAMIAIPTIQSYDMNIGSFSVSGDAVEFTNVGWSLKIEENGAVLTGVISPKLVPVYSLNARFERSHAPVKNAIAPLETSPATITKWEKNIGVPIWAELTEDPSSNLLFVAGEDGRVFALDQNDGETIWETNLERAIRSKPSFANGLAYIATDRKVVALNPKDGSVKWSSELDEELHPRLPLSDPATQWDHYGASVIVEGSRAYVAGRDGCVRALKARSGDLEWKACLGALLTATPALHGDYVVAAGFDGVVYALSAKSGEERWRYDAKAAIPRDLSIADGKVFVDSRSYDLLALDLESGALVWKDYFWFSWIDSPPVISDSLLFIGSSDALIVKSLSVRDGEMIWEASVPGWSWPRVVVGEQCVIASLIGSEDYIGLRQGGFVALDRETGERLWAIAARTSEGGGRYGFAASPIANDRGLFAADLSGNVYAFDLGADQKCW